MNDSLLVFPQRNVMWVGYGLVFVDEIDDGGRFARSRRALKHQIREIFSRKNVLENHTIDRIQHNIVESTWAVFFNPRYVVLHNKIH